MSRRVARIVESLKQARRCLPCNRCGAKVSPAGQASHAPDDKACDARVRIAQLKADGLRALDATWRRILAGLEVPFLWDVCDPGGSYDPKTGKAGDVLYGAWVRSDIYEAARLQMPTRHVLAPLAVRKTLVRLLHRGTERDVELADAIRAALHGGVRGAMSLAREGDRTLPTVDVHGLALHEVADPKGLDRESKLA